MQERLREALPDLTANIVVNTRRQQIIALRRSPNDCGEIQVTQKFGKPSHSRDSRVPERLDPGRVLLQRDLGEMAERLRYLLARVFEILQPAGEVLVVRRHVDVAVAGQVE